MNKVLFALAIAGLFVSCDPGAGDKQTADEVVSDFSGKLTAGEIAGGRMTPEILWKFGRIGDIQVSPDNSTIVYSLTRYDAKTGASETKLWLMPVEGGEPELLCDTKAFHPRWTDQGKKIGFMSAKSGDVQIWETEPGSGSLVQVTEIEGGINDFEYSPAGGKLYYIKDVKMRETPQEIYPDLPDANVRIIDELMYRHWNHWEDYSYSHIFVAETGSGKITEGKDILEGEPYDTPLSAYFDGAEISWSNNGENIAYTCKKMDPTEYATSTNSDIYLYKLEDGSTVNITEGMMGYDKYPVFSPDDKYIAFESMETPGYESDKNRLFIHNTETGEKQYLTSGFDQNVSSLSWKDDGSGLYFISGIKATFQYYEMDIESRAISLMTEGDHNYTSLAQAGDYLVGGKMRMDLATEIFRLNKESGEETQLSYVNKDIYDNIEMGSFEKRWVKTTDNKDMLVWVIYPPGFDKNKQYPALLYCQGGPQSAVSQFFSYRWNFQMMAASDYIIVAPNRRGLPTFGQEWNAQISGDYGGQNMKDYLSAIDALKKEPFIDENRLGSVGASYGGFSVFWLAGNHEGRFKAFISHCGIFNFESMYTHTEETFFVNHDYGGAYWEEDNNVAQRSYAASPHKFVKNWDTPILIITGENDMRIPFTQSMEAFNAARLLGVEARLLYFPEETHFVVRPQNSILWQREFAGWLDKYLK